MVKADTAAARSHREVITLCALASVGVPVSKIVCADGGSLPTVLALAKVPGPTLTEIDDNGTWVAVGRTMLRRLHDAAPPPELPAFDHTGATWVEFSGWWVDHEADAVVFPRPARPR